MSLKKKLAFNHRIAIIILVFSLLPCVALEIIYLRTTQHKWTQSALAVYQANVESNAAIISKNINELTSKIQYLKNNPTIRSSFSSLNKLTLEQKLDFSSLLDEAVTSVTIDSPDLVVCWYPYLSTNSLGKHCHTLNVFMEEFPLKSEDPSYQEITTLKENQFVWKIREVYRGFSKEKLPEKRLCLYTQMTNLNGSTCILELSISLAQILDEKMRVTLPNSFFFICLNQPDKSVDVLLDSSSDPSDAEALLNQYRLKGHVSGYNVISAPISNTNDSYVILFLSSTYTAKQVYTQITLFIIISILIALIIFSVSYFTSNLLTKRIISAVNNIKVDLKHFLVEPMAPNDNLDDITQISMHIRKLVQDTQEYCAQIEHYETEKFRMELELLQMRFNPHLLYHTLGAIRQRAKSPDIRSSLDSLCHYYRIILNNGHLIIKIEDEFEMIKEYLCIETFAYCLENVQFDFQIDEEIKPYTIIKHLLQPIVENALHHGIRPAEHNGLLKIKAFAENDCIYIQISDNGVGMSQEDTARLLTEPTASVYNGGYGIYNVQQRIQLYYGPQYGLTIDSVIGSGTTVCLRIPMTLEMNILPSEQNTP